MTDMMQPYNDMRNKEQEEILIKEYKKIKKTICIYHSRDLDGWMSAAIVKKWFEGSRNYCRIYDYGKVVETDLDTNDKVDTLEFLGWDYGDDIPDLKGYDKVIMCDVSFPVEDMQILYLQFGKNFTWLDHHSSAINAVKSIDIEGKSLINLIDGLRGTKYSACELTWIMYSKNGIEDIPEIVRLLGRYDCFGHKGTSEEEEVLEFQYGARQFITDYKEAYIYLISKYVKTNLEMIQNAGVIIYDYVKTEAKQIYKKSFPIKLLDPITFGKNPKKEIYDQTVYKNFLAVNQERFNPVNFEIDYHKDGYDGYACFWYKNGTWSWSLYNDNGETDCSVIAKQFGGGGHAGASGFVLSSEDNEMLLKTKKRYTVSGLNLSEFNEGDELYLDPNKPGTLTNKKNNL